MNSQSDFNLPILSSWYKKKFLGYASQVLEAQQKMTSSKGKNILHYTLRKKRKHERMSHYPKGDRIDRSTGSQYFYHCHRENFESNEHGHFHCFLRYKHIPKRIKPAPLEDWDKYIDNPMTHLVAIGMNQFGQPIRLFTVNRWVTSEIWYGAEHIPYFLKSYKMTLIDDPYWQVLDQWVEGMFHLFAPQIAWLHQERDKRIQLHQLNSPNDNPYTNHELEELSEINIDLKKQIEWVIS
ncbi:TPA: hypothetical protein JBF44_06830 [Legionella pneumophila]|uniref:DUF6969 family protein n=1 Tax=Legionella pneumophila TaxID=446 RepID=UPI000CEB0A17|nr:hypothetical protein [Legionella pneumophila]PPK27413.1 hypothetical protein C3929_08450 [Legionella pneumophila]HAU0271468.1 hypothetical protein [Legionella pneumophila]